MTGNRNCVVSLLTLLLNFCFSSEISLKRLVEFGEWKDVPPTTQEKVLSVTVDIFPPSSDIDPNRETLLRQHMNKSGLIFFHLGNLQAKWTDLPQSFRETFFQTIEKWGRFMNSNAWSRVLVG
jgi:hypothetical protein